MLSVWWGVKGIIYWELLPDGCTVTADLYRQQLDRVAQKLKGKQDRVYFLHDNAKLHVAKSTHEKLLKLGRFLHPVHLALRTWLLPTITCFDLSPITCARKSSMMRATSKRTWLIFSARSLWTFTNAGSSLYLSVGGRS
jgi:hypothetical protein